MRGKGNVDGQGGGMGQGGAGARVPGNFTPPQVIYKVGPEYTQEALDSKTEGFVKLSITVGTEGTAMDVRVVNGLGMGLDEKAVECVKQWKFKPATRDGDPTPTRAIVEINFRLPK
jgi:periplasmic protein TonB